MPFEENDMRIQEAANQHHPAYDEKAWEKMEKLLDQHLPVEKKDKRRIVFWLFLFMLTGGSVAYLLLKHGENKTETASVIKEKTAIIPADEKAAQKVEIIIPSSRTKEKVNEEVTTIKPNATVDNKITEPVILLFPKPSLKTGSKLARNSYSNPETKGFSDFLDRNKQKTQKPETEKDAFKKVTPELSISNSPATAPLIKKEIDSKNILPEKNTDNTTLLKNERPKEPETATSIEKKNVPDNVIEKPADKTSALVKQKNKKGTGLFFAISAGPETGKVGTDNSGTIKPVLGIGVGYAINKRISIQTGFYSVRKIYTAAGEDYKAPNWWQQYYPNLEEVNADCKVYEIPLTASYNFITGKKSNFFATLGFSSYLMRKESYVYHYKTSAGQYRTSSRTFNNEYKNFFSIANFSLGFERKISSNFSLAIAPYIKLPMSGVGFGKVKLNSGGIMVSAVVKPFAHK